MTEPEEVFQKKKKKKEKQPTEEAPEPPSAPHEITTEEVDSHKKHKQKKKKAKPSEEDDDRPTEVQCVGREGQKKRKSKQKAEDGNVTPDVIPHDGQVTKKRKKRRIEETVCAGENTGAVAVLTPVEATSETVHQKPVKSKTKKVRETADTHASTHTQPTAATHSPTDTPPHPDDIPREAPGLDVDEAALQEIREFLPDFSFSNIMMKFVIKYDLPRFREFKKQGVPLRTGRFTAVENKQLKQNVKDFLALSGIDSEFKLFRPHRFPDEKDTIMGLRRKLNFLMHLCAGIPRSWMAILSRAKKLCNKENYMGRFTEDENKALKKLHTLHGSNWATISDKMGRSSSAVQKRFAAMSEVHGSWSEAEFKTLLMSVREQLLERAEPGREGGDGSAVIKKKDLYKRLAWVCVSEQVHTRSWLQCREKWMDYLTSKMTTGGKIHGRKSLEGQIQLIRAMNDMAVEDPADIVWDDLTHLFGNTPPDYIQMRFYQLKVTYVPDWTKRSFCDILDFLYEKTLPKLEEELKTCEGAEEHAEPRQSYRLSEIFPDL